MQEREDSLSSDGIPDDRRSEQSDESARAARPWKLVPVAVGPPVALSGYRLFVPAPSASVDVGSTEHGTDGIGKGPIVVVGEAPANARKLSRRRCAYRGILPSVL